MKAYSKTLARRLMKTYFPETAAGISFFRLSGVPLTPSAKFSVSKKRLSLFRRMPLSSLHLVGILLIVVVVVGVFTGRSLRQTENAMARMLEERGNVIISLFESSLRSDMRTQAGVQLQALLEELVSREDLLFVALTLEDGRIIAHSDGSRVGQMLRVDGRPATPEEMKRLTHPADIAADAASDISGDESYGDPEDYDMLEPSRNWRIMDMEGRRAFVVQRSLALFQKRSLKLMNPRTNDVSGGVSVVVASPPLLVFIGQDPRPLQDMQRQNARSALFNALLAIVASVAAILAIQYFEYSAENRRRMKAAESMARQMLEKNRRLEAEVRRREKLAAVGDLAAGVAHELRNPLSSIKGYASYLGGRFPEGSEDREAARVMVQEVDRLNRVISDLIGVSRPTDIHPRKVDMAGLADNTLRLLAQDAAQRGVTLVREGEAEAWLDPDRFRQALLNVCLNAVEAMKDGGKLRLSFRTQGNLVYLDVRDNGPGIPQDILNRIFDPYFTTKSQGTGLGLAMVLKVTEAHGGSVRITSETEGPERGTTVRFLLPATPEAVEELARREKDSSSSSVSGAVPASADESNSPEE